MRRSLPLHAKLWSERVLIGCALFLVLTGVVMVYSASSIMAEKRFYDSFFFLKRHTVYAILGICTMITTAKLDYNHIRKIAIPFMFFSFSLLILLLIPGVGTEAGGATRWLRFGPLSLQPSEVAKLSIIFFFAHSLANKKAMNDFKKGFLPYLIVMGIFLCLMLMQPDFGTAMTVAGIIFIMLFVAGARPSYITSTFLLTGIIAYFLVATSEYRMKRILSFVDPWSDPQDTGFQIIQSFLAFGSGGLMGRGLGEGRQKLFYLPEPHTDFILPVVGEELGFIGVVFIILVFAALVLFGIRAALKAYDTFGCYLALGITSMIGLQAIINMGVVMGLLPTKGLPLPFVSYGGTSLLINMIGVGILISITARGRT
ncbi:MAG: putative lipid II flippase FtsW [Proteobacteria bacterium]|nr:putative lipid II flippase FtsW [Pseudomonadota bacterium]